MFCVPALWAGPVDKEQAMQKAQRFYSDRGQTSKVRKLKQVPRAAEVNTAMENDCFYVFNAGEDDGYVIISGDDRTPDVLGYCDSGSFRADDMPENMKAWLEDYAEQIRCLQQNSALKAAEVPTHPAVPVLMKSTWNQDDPYNQKCPVFFDESKYGRCVTGCVATAMAQVMYYHRYPERTTQTIPGYTCMTDWKEKLGSSTPSYITVPSVPVTKLDWSNMLDSYKGGESAAQQSAVATLMQAVGASLNMDYGLAEDGGSSATPTDMKAALITYFDYDKDMYFITRNVCTAEVWDKTMYYEMAASRPVLYGGQSTGGGHAFVLDGYDGQGYYHVNWGWGGIDNGYYLLSILSPTLNSGIGAGTSGYNAYQTALIGIKPNKNSSNSDIFTWMTTDCMKITGDTEFSRSDGGSNFKGIAVAASFMNYTGLTGTFDYGIDIADQSGNTKGRLTMRTNATLQNNWGALCDQGAITFNFGANYADGIYYIIPVSKLSSSDRWTINYGANTYFIVAEISGNKLRLSYPSNNMSVSLEPANSPEAGGPADLKITISSNGIEYIGHVMLFSEDAGGMLYAENVELTKENGYKDTRVATVIFEKAGTFEVVLSLDDGNILAGTNVTVSEPKTQSLKCSYNVTNGNNTTFEIAEDKMKLDINYTNEGSNLYDNNVRVILWKQNDVDKQFYIANALAERLTLAAGASVKRNYVLTGLENGETYYAQVYYRNKGQWKSSFSTTQYTARFTEPQPEVKEAYAVVDGSTLTFYYDGKKGDRQGKKYEMNTEHNYPGWAADSLSIRKAVIDASFAAYRPTTTAHWFEHETSLTSIEGLTNLNTSATTIMQSMFYECCALKSLDVSKFDTSNATDVRWMFYGCKSLTSLNVQNFNTSKMTTMQAMFYECASLTAIDVSKFDTRNVTDMGWMFLGCKSLTSLNVKNFNTSKVTNMRSMFYGCASLTTIDLSTFNTQKVTDMGWMFCGCTSLQSLNISNFNTSNVTLMNSMFSDCYKLKALDLSNFNTSKVTNMGWFCYADSALVSANVSSFNTANVTTMKCMFYDCVNLKAVNVSSFRTPKLTDMSFMFRGCSSLKELDMSGFTTDAVTEMNVVFYGCSLLKTIYASNDWNTSKVQNSAWMFSNCNSLVGGAGTTYDANHILHEYARIDGGPSAPGYFTYKAGGKKGDVNGDGTVDVADIATIIDAMASATGNSRADVNGDGTIDVADIATVIDIMAGKGDDTPAAPAGAVAVNLGLPSGTLWANMNVGAQKAEDYGDYFAWGETKPKGVYNWATYTHCNGSEGTCHNIGSDIAGTAYDAARANWGGQWQMPTYNQIRELADNCSYVWTEQNGVYGCKFTGPNGNSIFLPAAGRRSDSDLVRAGKNGYYWASTLDENASDYAPFLQIGSSSVLPNNLFDRFFGFSVRPVRKN